MVRAKGGARRWSHVYFLWTNGCGCVALATGVGLADCVGTEGLRHREQRDALHGPVRRRTGGCDARLHVEGTPTAFVNGRRIVGAQSLAVYRAAVDRALAQR